MQSSRGGAESGTDKVRFSLNQIRTWDKQNEAAAGKAAKNKTHEPPEKRGGRKAMSHVDDEEDRSGGYDGEPKIVYRDRALVSEIRLSCL